MIESTGFIPSPNMIAARWEEGKYEQAFEELQLLLDHLARQNSKKKWKELAMVCKDKHREWQAERLRSTSQGRPMSKELKQETGAWMQDTLNKLTILFQYPDRDGGSTFSVPGSDLLDKLSKILSRAREKMRYPSKKASKKPSSSDFEEMLGSESPSRAPQVQPRMVPEPSAEEAMEEAMEGAAPPAQDMPDVSFSPEAYAYDTCDWVNVSVFSHEEVTAGEEMIVSAFAHLFEQQEKVERMAKASDPETVRQGGGTLNTPIERGGVLEFHLQIRDWPTDLARQKIVWLGQPNQVDFVVQVPDDALGKVIGKLIVIGDKGPVGRIAFNFSVVSHHPKSPGEQEPAGASTSATMFRHTYLSYALEDEPRVKELEPQFQTIGWEWTPDSVKTNEADTQWKTSLLPQIRSCELFVLFWSANADQATRVEKEWLSALGACIAGDDGFPDMLAISLDDDGPEPPEPLGFLSFSPTFSPQLNLPDTTDLTQLSREQRRDLCFGYVRKGNQRVFRVLLKEAGDDQTTQDTIITLQNGWNNLEDQVLMQMITESDAKVARANINRSILSLVGRLFR